MARPSENPQSDIGFAAVRAFRVTPPTSQNGNSPPRRMLGVAGLDPADAHNLTVSFGPDQRREVRVGELPGEQVSGVGKVVGAMIWWSSGGREARRNCPGDRAHHDSSTTSLEASSFNPQSQFRSRTLADMAFRSAFDSKDMSNDMRDAITYAQTREEVDRSKIALWRYSLSTAEAVAGHGRHPGREKAGTTSRHIGYPGFALLVASSWGGQLTYIREISRFQTRIRVIGAKVHELNGRGV
ncbi:hypothetical protein AYO21_09145 [Fonsecaea monophora]|uniref:Uncharacterized protein n=1 Tax=Fonsecaea monophora TaxID=254056 RepID=A0A177EZJ1_9EURO|nr:hypothetical protein AYO21_09145 [Fonsecaea monophora]OAG36670.1 hypothetical protein AYO21_09145 [Fonsecaea monophora]